MIIMVPSIAFAIIVATGFAQARARSRAGLSALSGRMSYLTHAHTRSTTHSLAHSLIQPITLTITHTHARARTHARTFLMRQRAHSGFSQMCLFWVPFNGALTQWLPREKVILHDHMGHDHMGHDHIYMVIASRNRDPIMPSIRVISIYDCNNAYAVDRRHALAVGHSHVHPHVRNATPTRRAPPRRRWHLARELRAGAEGLVPLAHNGSVQIRQGARSRRDAAPRSARDRIEIAISRDQVVAAIEMMAMLFGTGIILPWALGQTPIATAMCDY